MDFDIVHRYTKAVLYSSTTATDLLAALPEAVKSGADLQGANLQDADLQGADLRGANLQDANLQGANLQGADPQGANLQGANLRGANLRGADLRGANLQDANLQDANLQGADLQGAKFYDSTVMPNGETWKEYKESLVPALLTAGGLELSAVASEEHWNCHDWNNCPMAAAFGVASEGETPLLLRPRVREFVQYFDARLIPNPITGKPPK